MSYLDPVLQQLEDDNAQQWQEFERRERAVIDAEKAKKWIATGAQPTDTVRVLLKKSNIL